MMNKLILTFLLLMSFLYSMAETAMGGPIKIVDYEGLAPMLSKTNDTVYVVNFWATWCVPCIKEMPEFEKIAEDYLDQNVKLLLVSLDFPSQVESRLIPFIEKNEIKSEVILLDDPNGNAWIDKVDPTWSGAIPATIIYCNKKRSFHEGMMGYDDLSKRINQYLKTIK